MNFIKALLTAWAEMERFIDARARRQAQSDAIAREREARKLAEIAWPSGTLAEFIDLRPARRNRQR